jgi:hypothetical protein
LSDFAVRGVAQCEWLHAPRAALVPFRSITKEKAHVITLKLTPTIRHEWASRSIGGVIPELDAMDLNASMVEVSEPCCREIAADCEFYLHPYGPDTTIGERSAYRALLKQCKAALSQPK